MERVAEIARKTLGEVLDERLGGMPLTVRFWDGSALSADPRLAGEGSAPAVRVRDPSAISHLLHEPNQVGLARAWVSGALEQDGGEPEEEGLERVLALRERYRDLRLRWRDRARLLWAALRIGGPGVLAPPRVPALEARVSGRRHSVPRDRAAVRYHYDVSNDFYRLLLGPSMVYSCAYFAAPGDSLEAAQERKLEVICRKLALRPGERLLDIGCGWGSLLLHAAVHHGVRGVGVTLSPPQARLAEERLRAAGLDDRVEVRVADYRELAAADGEGAYDKIASVGMYEHVGRSQLAGYVEAVGRLLRPGGLFLNHGIARLQEGPSGPKTFIARYVFPDGELHPVTDVMAAMQGAGLEARDVESLREHYALTLRRWVANLDARCAEATAQAGAQRVRVWRLYMLGSARAFERGELSIFQVLAARGGAPHGLTLARAAPPG
jgi:cyclopropane-fatty-acyl-phospholipid synthase